MPTRVLITGVTGPVGSFLADYLLTLPDVEIHAFKRWKGISPNTYREQQRKERGKS